MANLKISALPAVTTVGNTDVVPLVQGGATKAATVLQLLAPVLGANPIAALDTLRELADAIGDDPNYASDLVAQLAAKADTATIAAGYTAAVIVPPATGNPVTDWANIAAADTKIAAIVAAGGQPTLLFPACPTSGGTLVPYRIGGNHIKIRDGVTYQGVSPSVREDVETQGAYMPDSDFHFVAGTVLEGDGTAPCFWDEKVDQASPDTNVGATQYSGPGIKGFGLQNFTYGIKSGAKNVMGLVWSEVDGIYVRNCGWGVSFKNYQHVQFGSIRTCTALNGHMYFATDMTAGNWGNSSYNHLFARRATASNLVRGVVFESVDGSNGHSIGHIASLQVNAFNQTAISQTATLTSGTASIAVTDGTKFAVKMPVALSATIGGFTVGVVYLVASVTGNTITLAPSRAGAAITPNASGTATITTRGFAGVEFVSTSSAAGNVVGTVALLDVEGTPTVGLYAEYFQNSSVKYGSMSGTAAGLVARSCTLSRFHNVIPAAVDLDATSVTGVLFDGALTGFTQRAVAGVQYNPTRQTQALAVTGVGATTNGGHLEARKNNWLYPTYSSIGEHVYSRNTAITVNESNCGVITCSPTTPFTITLPTIATATGASLLNANVGVWYEIINTGTAAVTVNTDGTQLLNKIATRTTTTIAGGQTMKFVAIEDGSLWWKVTVGTLLT